MALEDVSPALQARLGPEATAGLLALLDITRREWQTALAEASAFAAATADKSTIEADVTAAAVERFEQRLTEESGGLRGEMGELRSGLRGEMGELQSGLRTEMRGLRDEMRELRGEMHDLRGEMQAVEVRLREEMRDLAAELREEGRVNTAAVREEMRSGVSNLRVELKDEMSRVRVDVADALAKARVDMMRWSFSLWVGQVVATAAIVAGMFRVFAQ